MSDIADANTPTVDEVARIVAMRDPVLRNLHITYCYSRLSAALAARTGRYNNWCTFATWASRQAGATIRGEDLADIVRRRLTHGFELLHPIRSIWRVLLRRGLFNPDTRLGRAIREIHSPFDAIERTSAAIAQGNLRVFEEIGAEFARYLAQCSSPDDPDGAQLAAFLQGLRPGDPPDGQGYLRRAFTHMHEMRRAPDPVARAELMALATVEIGFHEQTRLQAEILDALNSPLATTRDLKQRTVAALLPDAGAWRQLLERGPIGAALVRAVAAVRRFADRVTREAITECVMVLSLPDGTPVRLGGRLDIPIPETLRSGQQPDLRDLVGRLERCSPDRPSMGASDWSLFEERMHVILHVFCGFSERADLLDPPFSEEQVRTIVAGRVPDGRL